MRYRVLCILVGLVLPAAAWSGRLVSVNASKNTSAGFSIVSLHFDDAVPYTVHEAEDGRKLHLYLPDCQIAEGVQANLSSIRNANIQRIGATTEKGNLVLEFEFTGAMKPSVWESRNPFSLVVDISPLAASLAGTERESSRGTKPASQKESLGAGEKGTFKPAGARRPDVSTGNQVNSIDTVGSQQRTVQENRAGSTEEMSSEAHFQQGLQLRQQGHYAAALEHFQQAIQDTALFLRATTEIASIYRQLGRSEDEVAQWEKLFTAVKERGYPVVLASGDDEIPPGDNLSREVTSDSTDAPSSAKRARSVVGNRCGYYALSGIIALLIGLATWLTFKVRGLRTALLYASLRDSSGDQKSESPSESEPRDSTEGQAAPEPEFASSGETEGDRSQPKSDEEGTKSPRPAHETATEVYGLSEQGCSIQEIAEKLGLGQDEVRLILNLQRDEDASARETA